MADGGGDFAGTICSICYEYLKPLTQNLQSISLCGHVFHQLCLQQWFDHSWSRARKRTCPICKQICRASNACRLYFQSLGEVSEAVNPPKPLDSEEDVGVLRSEIKRLEVKVLGLSSELELKGKELEAISKQAEYDRILGEVRAQQTRQAEQESGAASDHPPFNETEIRKTVVGRSGASTSESIMEDVFYNHVMTRMAELEMQLQEREQQHRQDLRSLEQSLMSNIDARFVEMQAFLRAYTSPGLPLPPSSPTVPHSSSRSSSDGDDDYFSDADLEDYN